MAHPTVFGGATPPPANYQVSNSVRMNGSSSYLNRTPGVAGNRRKWTVSTWIKRSALSNDGVIFASSTSGVDCHWLYYVATNDKLYWQDYTGVTSLELRASQVSRDTSAWYHIMAVLDTAQPTASDRAKLYINGVLVALDVATYPGQNTDLLLNQTRSHTIGATNYNGGTILDYFNGYMSEFHFVDNQALPPSSFGKLDDNGVWVPVKYIGSYGTNGCKLEFKNSAALGTDTSGNGNNWTVNGLTAADQMVDNPTNNYATVLPFPAQMGSSVTMSNGSLTGTAAADYTSEMIATMPIPSSGKWYFETTYTAGTASLHGVVKEGRFQRDYLNYVPGDIRESRGDNGQKSTYASDNTTYGGSIGNTGTMMCLVDMDNGAIYFGNAVTNLWGNGTGAFDKPFSSAAPAFNDLAGSHWFPRGRCYGGALTFNFGQRPFIGTVPAGAKSLCTANLPAVSIPNPAKHFNTVLYTGTGVSRSVTLGFEPGLWWDKDRGNAVGHRLVDVCRGVGHYMLSNSTGAEVFEADSLTAFTSTGVTLGANSGGAFNTNGFGYVGWGWKAGGAAVTNNAGSITSQVSANPTAGFSVGMYVGNNSNGATVGHGLGAIPKMIIARPRTLAQSWVVYHTGIGASKVLFLEDTKKEIIRSSWFDTPPSSSVFSIGTVGNDLNTGGVSHLFYAFAEIAGYSKFGSYIGNGDVNADGPFVYCGFRPAWIMVKRTDVLNSWMILDTDRNTYNPLGIRLDAENFNSEAWTYAIDATASGFKIRDSLPIMNATNGSYIFAAFAEHPFGGANVAPSPAR